MGPEDIGEPDTKTLSTTGYINQPDLTTCGPTSAKNLLRNWGKNVSLDTLKNDLLYDGDQTPFGDHWAEVLNDHTDSSHYAITWAPSENVLWNAFVSGTIAGAPIILDVHIPTTGPGLWRKLGAPVAVKSLMLGETYLESQRATCARVIPGHNPSFCGMQQGSSPCR